MPTKRDRNEKDSTSKKRRKKTRKNREIIISIYMFVFLFVGMIGYLCHFVNTSGQEMINYSFNKRQQILTSKNSRGTIYSSDGEIVAESLLSEDGKETRIYPYDNLFSHTVGFSTKGRTGIEAMANSYLINAHVSLTEKVENEVSGQKNHGDNVYSTLRTDLQQIASKALGVSKGAIIVSEVKTGRVLAMVSKPDFNPNTIVQDWNGYVKDEKNSVLLNRATQGIYPPGSTFKIITSLAYIRQHPTDFTQYAFTCNGHFIHGQDKINCYHGTVHGGVDLAESFAKSCNASFANIGIGLPRDQFGKMLQELGFGQNLPLNMNYSVSNLSVDGATSDEDMIQISIGQGKAQITPILLHLITNSIAGNGKVMKPMFMDKVLSEDGAIVKQFKPELYKTLMTEEESRVLRELMTGVVENGTGKRLRGLSYTAAGKTGSAEYNHVKEDSHAWFTGFAPAEDPEISVTIIVEGIGSGGDYAVPIAKRIFDGYFGTN